MREGKEGEVYNVGGHNEETNLEIVKLTIATIRKLMTEKPEYRQVLKKKVKGEDGEISVDRINNDLITFVKDRLGHDQRYAIDPTKITNALGWYPETKFEDGIVKTIVWYLENQDSGGRGDQRRLSRLLRKDVRKINQCRIKNPIDSKIPINSILREVSPSMLFNFLPL